MSTPIINKKNQHNGKTHSVRVKQNFKTKREKFFHFTIFPHNIMFPCCCSYIYAINMHFFRPPQQSVIEFLKDLPCHDEHNFALFNTENGIRTSSKRPSVYLPTAESPSDQSKYHQNFHQLE